MRKCYPEIERDDCPNCKAKGGASMSSSKWRHNIRCCSDDCCEAISKKIEANTSGVDYHKAINELEKAKGKARSIKYNGTGVSCDFHIDGSI